MQIFIRKLVKMNDSAHLGNYKLTSLYTRFTLLATKNNLSLFDYTCAKPYLIVHQIHRARHVVFAVAFTHVVLGAVLFVLVVRDLAPLLVAHDDGGWGKENGALLVEEKQFYSRKIVVFSRKIAVLSTLTVFTFDKFLSARLRGTIYVSLLCHLRSRWLQEEKYLDIFYLIIV